MLLFLCVCDVEAVSHSKKKKVCFLFLKVTNLGMGSEDPILHKMMSGLIKKRGGGDGGGGVVPVEKVEPFSASEARGLERSEKCLV